MGVGTSDGRRLSWGQGRRTMLAGGAIAGVAAVVLASPSGCFIASDGLSLGGGATGTAGMTTSSSTGGTGGTGGMTTSSSSSGTGGCTTAADCPGGGSCVLLTCTNNVCGSKDVAAGVACTNGNGVCDGNGSCVGCTTSPAAGCTGSQYCYMASCASCSDGKKDGDETDVDCGGTHCTTPCAVGKACGSTSDCQASICGSNVCRVAHSCSELHTAQPSLPDGIYTVDLNGSTATAVYCDMTTAGGGWTSLVNPVVSTLPSTLATLTTTTALASGADTCSNAVRINQGNNEWGVQAYACGNATIQLLLAWANPIMAHDVMFSAVVQGDTTHTVSVNGAMIASDANDSGNYCYVWNANGTQPPTGSINTCWNTFVSAPAHVYPGALNGNALSIVVSAGPGSMGPNNTPDINYGTGMTVQQLAVR